MPSTTRFSFGTIPAFCGNAAALRNTSRKRQMNRFIESPAMTGSFQELRSEAHLRMWRQAESTLGGSRSASVIGSQKLNPEQNARRPGGNYRYPLVATPPSYQARH